MSKLMKYAADCTRISAEHGFWDEKETRDRGEMVALINSELSEALEAHRKGYTMVKMEGDKVAGMMNDLNNPEWGNQHPEKKELREKLTPVLNSLFETIVKDTVEDEMADTVIRVLDYIHGWDIKYYERVYRKESTGNFGHDILRLQKYAINAFDTDQDGAFKLGKDWGYLLAAIEAFCEWYHIDIEQHVQWKMKYNSTRPHRHGKKY